MFTKEPIETNHSSNMFTKELVKFHTKDLTLDNLTKQKNQL